MNWKTALFAVAIGWIMVNAAGLVMATAAGEPGHAGVHIVVAGALAVAAWFLRPGRQKPKAAIMPPPRVEALTDEIDRLQRELDEAQRGRDFAEQLLQRRPDPPAPH